MKHISRLFLIFFIFVFIGSFAPDANAFSRGLASKVRLMQDNAYHERLARAQQAYKSGDYKTCIQEAQQALQHASTSTEKAYPVHQLLAAAHTKLKNPVSTSEHLKWLAEHKRPI